MAEQKCHKCKRLFKQDEEVKAIIIARFIELKSKVHYALSRPTDCLSIEHKECPGSYFVEGD